MDVYNLFCQRYGVDQLLKTFDKLKMVFSGVLFIINLLLLIEQTKRKRESLIKLYWKENTFSIKKMYKE